jgi:hypothetical protein
MINIHSYFVVLFLNVTLAIQLLGYPRYFYLSIYDLDLYLI